MFTEMLLSSVEEVSGQVVYQVDRQVTDNVAVFVLLFDADWCVTDMDGRCACGVLPVAVSVH